VFKASSSILNAILTLLNERRFHNGRAVETVPLIALFGASNELPEDDELQALYDRFLLRFVVGYIDEDFRFLKMLQARPPVSRTTLSLTALRTAQAETAAVAVSDGVYRALVDSAAISRAPTSSRRTAGTGRRSTCCAHAYLDGRDRHG
jgi:MoxR-like ATPase